MTTPRGQPPPGALARVQAGPARSPAGITIRPMTSDDAAHVLAIYQAGLESGQASFETRAPTWEAFDASLLPSHRLVAVADASGEVAGGLPFPRYRTGACTRGWSSTPCTSPRRHTGAASGAPCSAP